ncbi:MAG: carboxyl transferase domain-containing protein [Actinomycetes bacterium]
MTVTTPEDKKLMAPRRLTALLDPGSLTFVAVQTDGIGALSATGTINGRNVVAFANDPSFQGGALGGAEGQVIVDAYALAMEQQCPIIGIWHSGGARLQEGIQSLKAFGDIFRVMTHASGKIPQVSVVLGPAAGGGAYGPALTDIVILGPEGRVFVTGPEVVRSVTGEDVDMLRLGGPEPHGRRSGVVHVVSETEEQAILDTRNIADLLGNKGVLNASLVEDIDLGAFMPESASRAYDVHPLVDSILDTGTGIELHPRWAPNLITALGRFGGHSVGLIANNPLRLGGCLDSTSAEKGARFVRMCDAFGIPLLVIVDVPGYLPGVGQEWDGVVRRGAKLLHAFAECVVPRITCVTRKSYGGAYIAMNSRSLGATHVMAWKDAEVAVMGPVAAIRILHRRRLAEVPPENKDAVEKELAEEHKITAGGLAKCMELGAVDEIVEPKTTRSSLAKALAASALPDGTFVRGNHGNIPL